MKDRAQSIGLPLLVVVERPGEPQHLAAVEGRYADVPRAVAVADLEGVGAVNDADVVRVGRVASRHRAGGVNLVAVAVVTWTGLIAWALFGK